MENTVYVGIGDSKPVLLKQCHQELKVSSSQFHVNKNRTRSSKRLWTKIVCSDEVVLKKLTIEPGSIVKVGSGQRLWKKVMPHNTVQLKHTPIDGSIHGHNRNGKKICNILNDMEIFIPEGVEFISYLPWLDMLISSVETCDSKKWVIEAEEV